MRIADFIEQSNRAGSLDELFAITALAANHQGYYKVAFGTLRGHPEHPRSEHRPPAVMLNYPEDWERYYFEKQYFEIDPVVIFTPTTGSAYAWDDLARWLPISRRQNQMFHEARDAGLNDGISVPIHGPCGSVDVVSFAAQESNGQATAVLHRLSVIAHQFHVAYVELGTPENDLPRLAALSDREKECLQWIAQGKSSWDIAVILSISENTVNFHAKNVLRKLNTNSRISAVVKAIRFGMILM